MGFKGLGVLGFQGLGAVSCLGMRKYSVHSMRSILRPSLYNLTVFHNLVTQSRQFPSRAETTKS